MRQNQPRGTDSTVGNGKKVLPIRLPTVTIPLIKVNAMFALRAATAALGSTVAKALLRFASVSLAPRRDCSYDTVELIRGAGEKSFIRKASLMPVGSTPPRSVLVPKSNYSSLIGLSE
jgi:hypothetical protein